MRRTMRMALNAYRNEQNSGNRYEGNRFEINRYDMNGDRMQGNEMRYASYNEMNDLPYEGMENRRRRDRRGRFMEYNNSLNSHYDHERREDHEESQHKQKSNVIGFKPKREQQKKRKENGLDFETAKEWVESMGEHFPFEMSKSIMQRVDAKECDPIEFWAIINSIHSDYGEVLEKLGISSPDAFGHLAKAWLEDEDAVENKAYEYHECIVQK